MIDFSFTDRLVNYPVRRSSYFSRSELQKTALLLYNSRYTPLISLTNEGRASGAVYYTNDIQFRNQALNKDRLLEILNSSGTLLKVKVTGIPTYIGKGFIGKVLNEYSMKPLMVYTVPEANYTDNLTSDLTILIDNSWKEESASVKALITACLSEHTGDVIYTTDVAKYITGKLKLPKFRTPAEKKEYTMNFVSQCVESF